MQMADDDINPGMSVDQCDYEPSVRCTLEKGNIFQGKSR